LTSCIKRVICIQKGHSAFSAKSTTTVYFHGPKVLGIPKQKKNWSKICIRNAGCCSHQWQRWPLTNAGMIQIWVSGVISQDSGDTLGCMEALEVAQFMPKWILRNNLQNFWPGFSACQLSKFSGFYKLVPACISMWKLSKVFCTFTDAPTLDLRLNDDLAGGSRRNPEPIIHWKRGFSLQIVEIPSRNMNELYMAVLGLTGHLSNDWPGSIGL
jgi:hypothetical protein